jgi:hypothetical protein
MIGSVFFAFNLVLRFVKLALSAFASLSMSRPVTIAAILAHPHSHAKQSHFLVLPFFSVRGEGVEDGWLLEQMMEIVLVIRDGLLGREFWPVIVQSE